MLDYNKLFTSSNRFLKTIGVFILFFFLSSLIISKEKKLVINAPPINLYKFDYAKTYLNLPAPIIWSIKVSDNYEQQTSIFSSNWDTIINSSQGNPINYSFWRNAKNGYHQITNLTSNSNQHLKVAIFSPIQSADTVINTSGTINLKQYQSVEYTPVSMATIRISNLKNQACLVYCMFGIDSIIPLALNTNINTIPKYWSNIKNIRTINDNQYQFRHRWNNKRIFIINLSSLEDNSVNIEFFPG